MEKKKQTNKLGEKDHGWVQKQQVVLKEMRADIKRSGQKCGQSIIHGTCVMKPLYSDIIIEAKES